MRRRRMLLVLVLALASGGIAGYSALDILSRQTIVPIVPEPPEDGTQVVLAARDVQVGEPLAAEDVRLVSWPANQTVPEGAAQTVAEVVGRGAAETLHRNEMVLNSMLGTRNGDYGLLIQVAQDERGLTLPVSKAAVVNGWYQPGKRADVILTMDPPEGGQTQSCIIMQNVELGAAGPVVTEDAEGNPIDYNLATFLVDPVQAVTLVLAQSKGTIQLALRNSTDTKVINTPVCSRTDALLPRSQAGGRAVASTGAATGVPVLEGIMTVIGPNGARTIYRY